MIGRANQVRLQLLCGSNVITVFVHLGTRSRASSRHLRLGDGRVQAIGPPVGSPNDTLDLRPEHPAANLPAIWRSPSLRSERKNATRNPSRYARSSRVRSEGWVSSGFHKASCAFLCLRIIRIELICRSTGKRHNDQTTGFSSVSLRRGEPSF